MDILGLKEVAAKLPAEMQEFATALIGSVADLETKTAGDVQTIADKVIAAAATTVVVNSSAVTANSEILVSEDQGLGTRLSATCNTQSSLVVGTPRITARSAGVSFTVGVDVAPTANPLCFNYVVVN